MNVLDNCNNCGSSGSFLSFIRTKNTTSIDLFGCGTDSNPLYAKIKLSDDEGNILELRSDGVYAACCGTGSGGSGGGSGDLNIDDTVTLNLSGDGSTNDPIIGDVNVSSFAGNTIQILLDGLYVANTIQAGVVYGGIVTWLQDYDYYVSPSGYYINGQFYESPGGFFTLSAPDLIDNRLDTFIVDVNGLTSVLEGTPSSNPAQAALDPALQLELSLALVEVGTTEPTIAVECVYRNNLEWATITSSVLTLDPDSIITPCAGAKAIKGDNVVTGNNITFTRSSTFNPITSHSQLVMLIRSEAWVSVPGNRLRLQWTLAGAAVASFVDISDGTYGFDAGIGGTCQIVAIPLSAFGLNPLSSIDGLIITASATSGTLNFTLDDICLQGQPVPIIPTPLDEKVKVSSDDTTPGYLDTKLTAGAGVVFTILNDGANESLEISSTDALTFDSGLTRTLDNVQLGGTLLHDTTIDNDSFEFYMIGSNALYLLNVTNSGSGNAGEFHANTASGTGVVGSGALGGVFTGITGVTGLTSTTGGLGGTFSGTYTSTATNVPVVSIIRNSSGTPAVGMGGHISFTLEATASTITAGTLGFEWSDATSATASSQFELNTVNLGVDGRKLAVLSTGQAVLDEYGSGTFTGTETYLLGVDVNGNVIETALMTTALITANNGLTVNPAQNVQLGGTLIQDTTINTTAVYSLFITGAVPYATHNGTLVVTNNSALDGNAAAVYGSATNNIGGRFVGGTYGAYAQSTTIVGGVGFRGDSIAGQGSSSAGVVGTSVEGVAFNGSVFNTTSNSTVIPTMKLNRSYSGVGADGIGQSTVYTSTTSTGIGQTTNEIHSKWTTALSASRVSQYEIWGVDSAVLARKLALAGNGQLILDEYGIGTFAATAAYILGVDASGNIVETSTAAPGGVPISSLLPAIATNTIDNVAYAQEWQWNTNLAASIGLALSSNVTGYTNASTLFSVTKTGTQAVNNTNRAVIINNTVTHSGFGQNNALWLNVAGTGNGGSVLEIDGTLIGGISINASAGIDIISTAGYGLQILSTGVNQPGIYAACTTGIPLRTDSNDIWAGLFLRTNTANNALQPVLELLGDAVGGVGAAGLGAGIDFHIRNAGGAAGTHRGTVGVILTDATNGNEYAALQVFLANNGSYTNRFQVGGAGLITGSGYGSGTMTGGAPTFAINVDASGNFIEAALGAGMTNPMGAIGDLITSSDGAGTPAAISVGVAGTVLTSNGVGFQPTWQAAGGGGSVVSVSVVTANGFAGTVATATTTPAITLTTSQTGILQGNGTSMTGIANSSTVGQVLRVTGASTYAWGALNLSTAAAITGDLPLANLAQGTARSVLGVTGNATADYAPIQGTSNQVLVVNNVGNALTFGQVNLASVSAVTGALAAVNGGTGQSTVAVGDLLRGTGVNTWGKLGIGLAGQVLTVVGGTAAWAAPAGGGGGTVTSVTGTANRITITGTPTVAPVVDIAATYVGQASITTLGTIATGVWNATTIGVTKGGTGLTSAVAGGVLRTTAANTFDVLAPGVNGQVLTMNAGVAVWGTISGAGTVTSVNGSGGTTGLTLTGGPITTSGTLTLGGTLGTVNGGTGLISYNQGDILYASAPNTLAKLGKSITATRYLANTGASNNPVWDLVNLTNGVTGDLPLANIAQGAGKSVLGVTGAVTADYAPITSTTADTIFRTNTANSAVGWGSINLASANAVGVSILQPANGGTGLGALISSRLLITTSTNTIAQATPTASNGITVTMGSGTMAISSTFNPARQTLTDTPPFTWNINNGEAAVMTLTNTGRTLVITNPVAGRTYVVEVVQDGVGNRTVTTWPVGTLWEGGVTPTLSTAPAKRDLITFYYNGANYLGKLVGTFN